MADRTGATLDLETTNSADDELYERRKRVLRRMKIVAFLMIVFSLVWVAVGAVTIVKAQPDNHIPYRIGGGCIGGGMGLLYALLVLCMSGAGKERPAGKSTTSGTFKCITKCHFVTEGFLWIALMVGFGISGIWGLIECSTRTAEDDDGSFSLNFCEPDRNALYALSICSFILGAVNMILLSLTNCMFCCNFKAFGMQYHTHYRAAYIDYHAGEETPTIQEVPSNEPLYIRTEHGFQRVDAPIVTPSAPPMSAEHPSNSGRYGRNRHENRDDQGSKRPYRNRPHDRPSEDRPDRPPHDLPGRGREHDDRRHRDRRPDDRRSHDRRPDHRRPDNRDRDDRTRRGRRRDEETDSERGAENRRPGDTGFNEDTRDSSENVVDSPNNTTNTDQGDSPPSYSEVMNSLKKDDV